MEESDSESQAHHQTRHQTHQAQAQADEQRQVLFGKYEMGRLLGQGTFAKVFHAKNLSTGESVAVKVIHKDRVLRRPGLAEQIQREISVMRLVRHPNVVDLREVLATRSKIYFVLQLVRGGELFARVARGRLPEDAARSYFRQLIAAVDYCHSRGVSHRDLKPENLLLDDAGALKVSDFGLSALPDQLRSDGLLHTQCGTPAYVAPEVLRRRGYDGAKADLWSCGVVLFVLLAGFLPFRDDNLMRMYAKIFKADFAFPPWFSPDSRRLVSQLLVPDPDRRIAIPAILRSPWLRSNPKAKAAAAACLSIDDGGGSNPEAAGAQSKSPPFFNAFELISSMSSGFDLSGMFESGGGGRRKTGSMFTARCSAAAMVAKIERVAKGLRMRAARVKDFKVRMEGAAEGRKGRLAVTAEVYEVAPEVAVVELAKSAGDTLEYAKFYEEEVRPALKDIVWTWQGE